MHHIINLYKAYLMPVRMFQQTSFHLQGVQSKALVSLCFEPPDGDNLFVEPYVGVSNIYV